VKVNYLSKRDSIELAKSIRSLSWGSALKHEKPRNILRIEEENFTLYRIDRLLICRKNELIFPTVHEEYNRDALNLLPAMIVDMGAVPHIAKGADVMRPGVREFVKEFTKGEIVVIKDERNLKPIAIALALENIDKCKVLKKGKIAENVHHVNDKIWKFVQNIKHLIDRS